MIKILAHDSGDTLYTSEAVTTETRPTCDTCTFRGHAWRGSEHFYKCLRLSVTCEDVGNTCGKHSPLRRLEEEMARLRGGPQRDGGTGYLLGLIRNLAAVAKDHKKTCARIDCGVSLFMLCQAAERLLSEVPAAAPERAECEAAVLGMPRL